jgi:hypothetical protein
MNKMKTTWHIVKSITGVRSGSKSLHSISLNGLTTENQQLIADSFKNHFLSTADKIITNINNIDDAEHNRCIVRFEVFTSVTMENVVFCDIKTQFVLHRTHITSPLQSPAG